MTPLKATVPPWPFRYVNSWLGLKSKEYAAWSDGTTGGMPVTRIYRACTGSAVDWTLMASVAAVKSDYWRRDPGDWFACGIGGTYDDQVINASIAWQALETTGDLKLSELELQQVDIVHQRMTDFCKRLAEQEQGEPLPTPPPPPPKPVEPPKPAEPPPAPVPLPEPKPAGSWRKTCAMIAGVLGGGLFLAKLFLPGSIVLILEAVQKILASLGG